MFVFFFFIFFNINYKKNYQSYYCSSTNTKKIANNNYNLNQIIKFLLNDDDDDMQWFSPQHPLILTLANVTYPFPQNDCVLSI